MWGAFQVVEKIVCALIRNVHPDCKSSLAEWAALSWVDKQGPQEINKDTILMICLNVWSWFIEYQWEMKSKHMVIIKMWKVLNNSSFW